MTISATFDGITGSTGLTVTAAALKSIAVTPANPSLSKGETEQFTATGTLSDNSTENLTSQVTWASATTSVATITAGGLATAVATGTSSISAKFDGISGTTVLTVTGPAALSPVAVKANSQGGYYQYGAWVTVSGGYNGTYEVANPQVSSTASNRWNLTLPVGNYDLYATWVTSANNATNAGYTVYDGFTKLGSFQANQQIAPGDGAFGGVLWAKLGAITVTQGKLTIAMSASGANGDIVANAILLTPVSVAATAKAAAATVSGSLSPSTSIPMGPIATASTSGPVQNGGGAGGTVSSSTPAVASLPGGAVSPATSIAVNDAAGTTTGDAETPPSTSQSLSVTDHAIAEVAKGHPRKQRKSLIERLAGARVSESHLSAGHHHPKA